MCRGVAVAQKVAQWLLFDFRETDAMKCQQMHETKYEIKATYTLHLNSVLNSPFTA